MSQSEVDLDGKFVLLEKLGEGGMGVIHKALQVDMHRYVAIKRLKDRVTREDEYRFKREARIIGKLNHPNIVSIYAFGIADDGCPYLAMELLEGSALSAILDTEPLAPTRVLPMFVQICNALEHAHTQGVVHRDIKPSNIFVVAQQPDADATDATDATDPAHHFPGRESIRLLDFGVARLTSEGKLTKTNVLLGSTFYVSPEQCSGGQADHRSDLYALGCTLFESLAGHPPFTGDNPLETVQKHLQEPPPLLSPRLVPDDSLREALHTVIAGCLAKDPDLRYQSAKELRADLELVMAGSRPQGIRTDYLTPAQKGGQRRTRGGMMRAAFSALLLLILSASAYLISRPPNATTNDGVFEDAAASEQRAQLYQEVSRGHEYTTNGEYGRGFQVLSQCCQTTLTVGDPLLKSKAAREFMNNCSCLADSIKDPREKVELHKRPVPYLQHACTALTESISQGRSSVSRKELHAELSHCQHALFYCYLQTRQLPRAIDEARHALDNFRASDLLTINEPDHRDLGAQICWEALPVCVAADQPADAYHFAKACMSQLRDLKEKNAQLANREVMKARDRAVLEAKAKDRPDVAAQLLRLLPESQLKN